MSFVRSLSLALPIALALVLAPASAFALVNYDKGARTINGVRILQDAFDEKVFYYVPQFPRLSTKADGETFEFLCVKYVGADGEEGGGLIHALVEFKLPSDQEKELEEALQELVKDAELRGPVPMLEAVQDGDDGMGSFRVVSATLSDTDDGGFTRSMVTSGRAPLAPGSKAVIAAMLNEKGATLMWETLQAPTSDISIAITGYYEAKVEGYNARVSASSEVVYKHFSKLGNKQKGFKKEQIRKITDELVRDGDIKVEVFDRSESLGMDASQMQSILDIVTTRVTDLMFDTDVGWSAAPAKEVAVEAGQVPKRQETGAWDKFWSGTQDEAYITDTQFVLKNRKDIQRSSFNLNLSQSTTIKVPVDSSGNLGGLYEEFKDDPRYFQIVNLADAVFENREVQFQVDADYIDSFQDTLNFVTVNFRKTYDGQPTMTKSLVFTHEEIVNGTTTRGITYPRLGVEGPEWQDFEYQIRWSVRDRPTVSVPRSEDEWITSNDPAVSLVPPFRKRTIEVETDLDLLAERGIVTAVLEFATPLAGKPKLQRKATIRYTDADPVQTVSIYHDRDRPVGWRVTWYTREGPQPSEAQPLSSDYLYLVAPEFEEEEADDSDYEN